MKHIAVLGGTFDPIHQAHLNMAKTVFKTNNYDEILIIPTGIPSHKGHDYVITEKEHRWNMCVLSILSYPYINISDIELYEEKVNYTVNTLMKLNKLYPENKFSFIIGADSIFQLDTWHKPDLFHTLCDLIVISRPGYEKDLNSQILRVKEKYNINVKLVEMPLMDISSSQIRAFIEENKDFSSLVPKEVFNYINEFNLYKNNPKAEEIYLNIKDIEAKLKENLSKKRFEHSISTKNTAIEIAKKINYNIYKAGLAGLLHDCGRELTIDEFNEIIKDHNLSLNYAEKNNLALLHAKVGAILAEKIYNVKDKDILNAIKYHTTGRPNMTQLEKIIYIADYIEPNRKGLKDLLEIRELANHSINKALIKILESAIWYLKSTNKIIDKSTLETYSYYIDLEERDLK